MYVMLGVLALEVLSVVAVPLDAALVDHLGLGDSLGASLTAYAVALLTVLLIFAICWEAWVSTYRGGFIDQALYIGAVGLCFSHLLRKLDTYDTLFTDLGGLGTVEGEVMIIAVYVVLPFGVTLAPVMSMLGYAQRYRSTMRRWLWGRGG